VALYKSAITAALMLNVLVTTAAEADAAPSVSAAAAANSRILKLLDIATPPVSVG
jgi:hypothetical protein